MAESSLEVEQKFSVHGLFVLPALDVAGLLAVPGPTLTLRAVYYDTADLRLAREGITVRHRTGEGMPVWTVKLPRGTDSGGALVREEITTPGGDRLPGEIADLLTAWLRGASLQQVATLRTRRSVVLLCEEPEHDLSADAPEPVADGAPAPSAAGAPVPGALPGDPVSAAADPAEAVRAEAPTGASSELPPRVLAEVVDDTVSVLEGRRVVSRFRELEVERRGLDPQRAQEVAQRLLAAGALTGDPVSKVVRALGPRASAPPDLPEAGDVGPSDPASALVAAALRTGTRRLVTADPGARRGEPEAVHQMRVAARRLRSDLTTLQSLLDGDHSRHLRVELRWLGEQLGAARDVAVARERLTATAWPDRDCPLDADAQARLDSDLHLRAVAAAGTALSALRSTRYLDLLDALVAAAREPRTAAAAQDPAADVLAPLLARAWRAMAKPAGRLRLDGSDDAWHDVRKRAKAARYGAELCEAVLGKPARKLAVAATAVQTTLGEHQDAAFAAELLLDLAAARPHDGACGVLCGRLAERERAALRDSRRKFLKHWKRLNLDPVVRDLHR